MPSAGSSTPDIQELEKLVDARFRHDPGLDKKEIVSLIVDVLRGTEVRFKKDLENASVSPDNKREMDDELKAYSPKGRKQRVSTDRPRPDLPSDAPANRRKKQIAVYLEPDFIDALNNTARERGVDRNTLIQHALQVFLAPKQQP